MGYQYTTPYAFDSHAFETTFSAVATPAQQGIAVSVASARNQIPIGRRSWGTRSRDKDGA